MFKSLWYGNKIISCIPPVQYGERFINFMKGIFETPSSNIASVTQSALLQPRESEEVKRESSPKV